MPLSLAASLALLLAPGTAAAARFASSDGVFALDAPLGWAAAPAASDAVLSLRRDKASITAAAEDDDADLALLLAAAAANLGRSRRVHPERRESAGGFIYLLGPVEDDFIATASVGRQRYSFLL